jgi:serine/threonine protein kinase
MSKLSKPILVQTAFAEYELDEIIGEGGAGRVYGGHSREGEAVAVKFLTQSTTDKRRRFKNEISFLAKTKHKNLVAVSDYGITESGPVVGPFYVMHRFETSLRGRMEKGVAAGAVMPLFSQVLDGVEAAHLLGVTHRDLKPENVLVAASDRLAIADFGIAAFTADQLVTMVETKPTQRLANFIYAAPEQKQAGSQITPAADIYALGLLLNELFTGAVPHGTSYRLIGDVSPEHAYLDGLVAEMIAQAPERRPKTIEDVKSQIQKYQSEAVSLQRLSQLEQVVIPSGEIDDPLAHRAPKLKSASWDNGSLTLVLDTPVNPNWNQVLSHRLGSYSAPMGVGPERFQFSGDTAVVAVDARTAQSTIDHFKEWLPKVTAVYKHELEKAARAVEDRRRRELQRELLREQQRLEVNKGLRI